MASVSSVSIVQDGLAAFGPRVRCSTPYGHLPLFIEPADDRLGHDLPAFAAWLAEHRAAFEQALLDNGAVVFRGFPIHTTDDFGELIEPFPPHQEGYAGGAALRSAIKGRVMESTRMAKECSLPLHQEMSYLRNNPRLVAFFCRIPSETGGETVIADMRRVTDELPPELLNKFHQKGVRYTRNLLSPDAKDGRTDPMFCHNNWVANFGTGDRAEVEQACADRGMRAEWLADGSLNVHNDLHGTTVHPVTGKLLYFNQAHTMVQSPWSYGPAIYEKVLEVYGNDKPRGFNSTFGDGTPLGEHELELIYRAIERASVAFPWQAGDVMFVENKVTAHGRAPFTGERAVEVALID